MTSSSYKPWGHQRRALRIGGAVAVAAGVHQAVTGLGGVLGAGPVVGGDHAARNVDSELRFYGAWYAAAGAMMLRTGSSARADRSTTRVLGAGWLLAATGRVLSWRAVGRPHPLFIALGLAEVALAAELLGPGDAEMGGR